MQFPESESSPEATKRFDETSQETIRIDEFESADSEITPFYFNELQNETTRQLTIELGESQMTRTESDQLKPGHVLKLDTATEDPIVLRSDDGRIVATGHLVVSGDRVAIKIEERLDEKRFAS